MKSIADPVSKAVWYIESHFASDLSPDDIADNAGASRFNLTRAFAATTGLPLMQYVRGRRLSEAARALAAGAPQILTVALDAGYSSHEAFTRAFRDQFGITPEAVRERGTTNGLAFVEAVRPDDDVAPAHLEAPRIEHDRGMRIAGLTERDRQRFAALWQRFGPYIGSVPTQIGNEAYGVCIDGDAENDMTYMAGVEVARADGLPAEFTSLQLAASRYAVFVHRDHISTICATFDAIYRTWQPNTDYDVIEAPFFERYDERFDPRTGMGDVEIWVPIR